MKSIGTGFDMRIMINGEQRIHEQWLLVSQCTCYCFVLFTLPKEKAEREHVRAPRLAF